MSTTTLIGARIRALRIERGMTQDDLAARLSTAQTTVSRWELGGTITVDQLDRIAEELGVSLVELVGEVAA